MEVKDKVDDFFDSVKERLKSNFLVTFIAIWLIHNWRVVFILLNFDSTEKLDNKLERLNKYFTDAGFCDLWFWPVVFSLISIVVYYLMSSGSEIIFIIYQNVRKWIYKKWDNKKIKTIEEYEEKVKENKGLHKQITDLEDRRENLLLQNTRLEDEVGKVRKTNGELNMRNEEFVTQVNGLEDEIQQYIAESGKKGIEIERKQTQLNSEIDKVKTLEGYKEDLHDLNLLYGGWNCEYTTPNGEKGNEPILIEGNKYYITWEGRKQHVFDITDFVYDRDKGTVFFIKELTNEEKLKRPRDQYFSINRLSLINDEVLEGTENVETKIKYKRVF